MKADLLKKKTLIIGCLPAFLTGAFLFTGCETPEEEDNPFASLVGSWNLPGGFNINEPHIITFFENGEYVVYSSCEQNEAASSKPNLEIGTYTATANSLTITSHIQNGCGGFDSDEDEDLIPSEPIRISFNSDGTTVTLKDADLTLTRVISDSSPLVGSWDLPNGFDSSNPHLITFFESGEYIVYTDCSQQEESASNVELEIGYYTASETSLSITGHFQNGCGGFDDDEAPQMPPSDPINISFSENGKKVTLTDKGLTLTRILSY